MTDDSATPTGSEPLEPMGTGAGDAGGTEEKKPRALRGRWPMWAALGVVVVGLTVALIWALTSDSEAVPATSPTTVAQPSPTPTPSPTPSPSATPSATPSLSPSPSPASHVTITETKSMAFSPVWDPPDHGENFWQIVDPDYGYPESGGTQYVLAHACAAGDCAGDEFRKLHEGDTLTYKGETYQVEDRWKVWKEEIAQQDIWYHDPDRIVLITCIIEVQGVRAVQNDIIIATKA